MLQKIGLKNGIIFALVIVLVASCSVRAFNELNSKNKLILNQDSSLYSGQNKTHTLLVEDYIHTFIVDVTKANALKTSSFAINGEDELIKVFVFGKFTDLTTEGEYITINAVNLRIISFKPFKFLHFIDEEQISFSNQYHGLIIENYFLFGVFNMLNYTSPHTPFLECSPDSTGNRLVVVCADADIKWSDIEITTDNPAVIWQVFSHSGVPLDIPNHTDGITEDVLAGDYVQLSGTTGNVTVTFRYIPTNKILGTWTVNV